MPYVGFQLGRSPLLDVITALPLSHTIRVVWLSGKAVMTSSSEEDLDWIINSCATSDDLGVVGVKIGVKELNVAFDCSAVCSDLPQIRV